MGKRAILGAAVLALALTGCGGQVEAKPEAAEPTSESASPSAEPSRTPTPKPTTEKPSPTPEPSPTPPADGGTYGSVGALKDVAVAAGMECPAWDESNHVTLALGSGTCSEDSVLAIYLNEASVAEQLDVWKQFGDIVEMEVLVGANWTLNASSSDAEDLQKVLGGSIFRTNGSDG